MGKFCSNCGKEVEDGASFCGNCGKATLASTNNNQGKTTLDPNKNDAFCIIGFVLSFFIPILGFVFSIIGLNKIKDSGQKGQGLAIAGIIISVINWILGIIIRLL